MPYQEIIDYFDRCLQNDFLANVYFFYGPDNAGKEAVVEKLIDKIFEKTNSGNFLPNLSPRQNFWYGDLLQIAPDENNNIPIAKAREIKKFLNLSPIVSQIKAVIIQNAQCLAEDAQNTLLKTLEESPRNSLIIIMADNLSLLLPTIVSRAVKLPFWRIPVSNLKPVDASFLKFLKANLAEKFDFASEILKKETDLKGLIKSWLYFMRLSLADRICGRKTMLSYDLDTLLFFSHKLQEIYVKLVKTNLNPKYAFDELILVLS